MYIYMCYTFVIKDTPTFASLNGITNELKIIIKRNYMRVHVCFLFSTFTEQLRLSLLKNSYPFLRETTTIMKVLTLNQFLYDSLKLAVDITR